MLGFTTQSDVSGSIPEDRFFRSAERSTLYLSKVAISCADIQVMHSKHTGVFISASYLSILPQSRPQRSSDITSIEWLNPHHPLSRSYHRILSWNMSSDGDKSSDYVNAETLKAKGGRSSTLPIDKPFGDTPYPSVPLRSDTLCIIPPGADADDAPAATDRIHDSPMSHVTLPYLDHEPGGILDMTINEDPATYPDAVAAKSYGGAMPYYIGGQVTVSDFQDAQGLHMMARHQPDLWAWQPNGSSGRDSYDLELQALYCWPPQNIDIFGSTAPMGTKW